MERFASFYSPHCRRDGDPVGVERDGDPVGAERDGDLPPPPPRLLACLRCLLLLLLLVPPCGLTRVSLTPGAGGFLSQPLPQTPSPG